MDTPRIVEIIGTLPLFSHLEREQVERLARSASVETIPAGGLYFSEQASAQGLHLLIAGRVKLFKMSEEGREQTIFIFDPGEPFCLCSVFSDGQLPANMAALESSTVLVIPPVELERLVAEDPGMLLQILRVMSRRLKEAMDMIDALSLRQLPSRLAAYFLSAAAGGAVTLSITHRELAKIIGATPEALSRALRKMSEAGLVDVQGKDVKVLDRSGLEQCRASGLS
ncbi:helix-turn-helix domain-containing protein [Pseudodesulfovibrio sp. F-1]|uniref:Helix-turn-helix domain-containing protein n=2 Tax=Pseudodesulfovibrio alkaliphilus TaxID=2661613 RepID=A0A7K1KJH3_9BACT|nr:helix-turn-helix domain-containing protein [Pseudodesulfovibrio alkaliphilus]